MLKYGNICLHNNSMKPLKLKAYLTETILLSVKLWEIEEDWEQEFRKILIIQKQKNLRFTASLTIVISIVVLSIAIIAQLFSKKIGLELLLLNENTDFLIKSSHILLFVSTLYYIYYFHKSKPGELRLPHYIYFGSILYFVTVMFLILWIYLGVNTPFIAGLVAYIFLFYSPNRLNLYSYIIYCLLYFYVIIIVPQTVAYKFIALITGIIAPLFIWLLGEANYQIKLKDFINRKNLEQQSSELMNAYNDIYRLNQRLNSENQRMESELNISQELQSIILPRQQELKSIGSLDVAAIMSPATEVGGDYYDFLVNDDHTRATIAVADVTGHGLESGIFTIMIQTAVRMIHNLENYSIKASIQILNKILFDNARRMNSDKSLTFSLIKYNQGIVQIYGQHEDIVLVRQNGELTIINTFNLGFPLGLEQDISDYINCKELVLNSGDGLILYTDGVTEAINHSKEFYGIDRLCQVIEKNYFRSAEAIKDHIVYDLMEFINTAKIHDDITLLVIKQK